MNLKLHIFQLILLLSISGCDGPLEKVHMKDENLSTPNQIVTRDRRIAIGYDVVLGVKNDGSVWSWGCDWKGLLARSVPERYCPKEALIPGKIMGLPPARSVYISLDETMYVLARNGTIWWWRGKKGLNTHAQANMPPQRIPNLDGVIDVSVGSKGGYATTNVGKLYRFYISYDVNADRTQSLKLIDSTLALKRIDGSYGIDQEGNLYKILADNPNQIKRFEKIKAPSKVVDFSYIGNGLIVLLDNGHIWRQGTSNSVIPTGIYPHLSRVRLIAGGYRKVAAWTEDGRLVAFGGAVESSGQESTKELFRVASTKPSLFAKDMSIKDIYADRHTVAAVDVNDNVWFMMSNAHGQFGIESINSDSDDDSWRSLHRSLFSLK